jgi:isopentenyl-diphosphate Delta-isomerase
MSIEQRKKDHVEVCMTKDVGFRKSSGFEKYDFLHNALPDIDFSEVDTETEFLGKKLSMPFIIGAMTGGPKLSEKINRNLAIAAERCKVAMGVGSQRVILEKGMNESFNIRKHAPTIALLANLGAVQLNYGYTVKECRQAVEMIKADALVLHLNPMQEVIQGGDTNFKDLSLKIKSVCAELGYPVIVKEVGFGISKETGRKLEACGVYGIDVSGAGGISWAAVESYLGNEKLGKVFWDWGIPTTEAIIMNKGKLKIIAGGGIKNGLDAAKAIALGADYVSMAGFLLKAAMESPEKVVEKIEEFRLELRTAMFATGVKNIDELKATKALVKI